MMQFIQIFR